jgi:hypothetical protein
MEIWWGNLFENIYLENQEENERSQLSGKF